MNTAVKKTIFAAMASMFFGMAFTAPLPWAWYLLGASNTCLVIMRLIP
jgi:hypothetical protein